jgi:hypothetical protein
MENGGARIDARDIKYYNKISDPLFGEAKISVENAYLWYIYVNYNETFLTAMRAFKVSGTNFWWYFKKPPVRHWFRESARVEAQYVCRTRRVCVSSRHNLARLSRNDDVSHVFRINKNVYAERIDVVNHQSKRSYNSVQIQVRNEKTKYKIIYSVVFSRIRALRYA